MTLANSATEASGTRENVTFPACSATRTPLNARCFASAFSYAARAACARASVVGIAERARRLGDVRRRQLREGDELAPLRLFSAPNATGSRPLSGPCFASR
jgi:hypothetical protein